MKKNVKQLIVDAAIFLFNQKGYDGTSIRDIAKNAGVNIANISYYFNNKHGLLEYCLTNYFEEYVFEIERGYNETINKSANVALKTIAENVLLFQSQNSQLTRFVLREVSIDSQVAREIMTTYYTKERYFLEEIFGGHLHQLQKQVSINYLIMQFKGLLTMPYLNAHYLKEVLQIFPHETYFVKRYLSEIEAWINHIFAEAA